MFNIDLTILFLRIPAAFCALVLHEMVKAHCSTWMGDPLPKKSGLMSGNPFKYLEPIGFIITLVFGFGWGRPTPTSPLYYKDRHKGIFVTYLTPSLVNLFFGLTAALFVGALDITAGYAVQGADPIVAYIITWLFRFILTFAHCSVAIALFNMIPVPPLDASKLLQSAVSPNLAVKLSQNEKVLQLVLFMLIVFGIVSGVIVPATNTLIYAAGGFTGGG